MREVDGLGPLKMRVARHRPVEVALGEREHRALEALEALERRAARGRARTGPCPWRPGRCASAPCAGVPPTGPAISVRRRSIAMWMSSSSSRNAKSPASSSSATRSSPAWIASRSSALMIPASASIDACARDCSMSYGARRQSKPIEAFRAWKTGSWGSAKRDMRASCRQWRHACALPASTTTPRLDCSTSRPRRTTTRTPGRSGGRAGCSTRSGSKPGHTAAWDRTFVAEVDGRVAGVLVSFAAADGDRLARRFLAVSLARLPAWRWPLIIRHLRASSVVTPIPPGDSLYVDALAVGGGRPAPRHRHGAAGRGRAAVPRLALQRRRARHRARQRAPRGRCTRPTASREREIRRAPDERVARAVGGPGFVSYFKPLPD